MSELRERFLEDIKSVNIPTVLVVAVKLPSGAIETITNYTHLQEKIKYYQEAYDDNFRLIANSKVEIVGYMLV